MKNILKMNMGVSVLVGLLATISVFSCQSESRNKQVKAIELLENTLYASQEIDRNKGIQLIESYCNFSQQFPDDTLSAHYLYKAGEIAMNFKLGSQSITCFDKIINNYPTFSKVPECLFLKAFILDDQLKDYEKARKIYNEFIAKYPNHPLAKDAKASLEYLGKSPEELVKMFQEKNKAN